MPQQTRSLLTTVEAAEILGIDRSTLSRHVTLGHVQPAMQLPGKRGPMLFDPQVVRLYAKRLRDEGKAAS